MKILRALRRLHRGENFSRRHQRVDILLPARLHLTDAGYAIDGFLNEISLGGARFRPEQTYLLRRANTMITVIAGDFEIQGVLRNVAPLGYGIQFKTELDERMLADILSALPAIAA